MASKRVNTLLLEMTAKASENKEFLASRRLAESAENYSTRQENVNERGERLKDKISKFLEEGWEVLKTSDLNLKHKAHMISGPNVKITGRTGNMTPKKAFDIIFTDALKVIQEILNRNLGEWYSFAEPSNARYVKKKVDSAETRKFFGILITITTMKGPGHGSSYENFRDISNPPMGWQRYRALLSAYEPNDEEFAKIEEAFRTSFQNAWIPGRVVAVDEAVWSYSPGRNCLDNCTKEGIRIPLVYIPRKPHPNGQMAYLLGCESFLTGLPFIIDFALF
jgi:hypothetical protein